MPMHAKYIAFEYHIIDQPTDPLSKIYNLCDFMLLSGSIFIIESHVDGFATVSINSGVIELSTANKCDILNQWIDNMMYARSVYNELRYWLD